MAWRGRTRQEERRRTGRRPLGAMVHWSGGTGVGRDASRTGLSFETSGAPEPQATLAFTVATTGCSALACVGEVVWVEPLAPGSWRVGVALAQLRRAPKTTKPPAGSREAGRDWEGDVPHLLTNSAQTAWGGLPPLSRKEKATRPRFDSAAMALNPATHPHRRSHSQPKTNRTTAAVLPLGGGSGVPCR